MKKNLKLIGVVIVSLAVVVLIAFWLLSTYSASYNNWLAEKEFGKMCKYLETAKIDRIVLNVSGKLFSDYDQINNLDKLSESLTYSGLAPEVLKDPQTDKFIGLDIHFSDNTFIHFGTYDPPVFNVAYGDKFFSVESAVLTDFINSEAFKRAKSLSYYKKFLDDEMPAKTEGGTVSIKDFTRLSDGKAGVDRYSYFGDENGKTPFLHIEGLSHSVLFYDGKEVNLIYQSPITRTEGTVCILKDGSVYSNHLGMGKTYCFASFSDTGEVKKVEFFAPDDEKTNVGYSFDGIAVSENEWEQKAKPFLDKSSDPAEITWIDWSQQ